MMRACGISNLVHALDLLPLLLCFSASRFPQLLRFSASLVLCLENQKNFKHAHFNCSCCNAYMYVPLWRAAGPLLRRRPSCLRGPARGRMPQKLMYGGCMGAISSAGWRFSTLWESMKMDPLNPMRHGNENGDRPHARIRFVWG